MEEYCDRNMLSPATEWNFTERDAQDQIMPFSCSDSGRLRASEVAGPRGLKARPLIEGHPAGALPAVCLNVLTGL